MKYSKRILVLITSVVFLATLATAADTSVRTAKGKTIFVTFSSPHKFGGFTLKPGNYQFQHRLIDGEHFMYVTFLNGRKLTPGGARCRIEPLQKKATATEITTVTDGDTSRITRIVISGEAVAHVFDSNEDPFSLDLQGPDWP